jgi:hypothetical protein
MAFRAAAAATAFRAEPSPIPHFAMTAHVTVFAPSPMDNIELYQWNRRLVDNVRSIVR